MVSQSTLTKQANALVTLFIQQYVEKYGKEPTINRFREKWAFQDMIGDLGYENARILIEYYFKTGRAGHPVQYLLYNYDKLDKIRKEVAEDAIKRAEIRRATEKRVKEWEAKIGNEGS